MNRIQTVIVTALLAGAVPLAVQGNILNHRINELETYYDHDELSEYFDDCTVALIGNRYKSIGYDDYEEDYYQLTNYEEELAQSEAGKRVCRWTKKDMLTNIGQCMGVLLAFYDLRQQYDYLKTELDILRGENAAVLQTIKEIEKAYDRQSDLMEWQDDPEFEKLLRLLPDRIWIE